MGPDSGASPKLNVLGLVGIGGLLILSISYFRTLNSLHAVETQLATIQADQSKVRDVINAEMAKLRAATAADEAARQKSLEDVRLEMEKARRQAHGMAGRVKAETLKWAKVAKAAGIKPE